MKFLPCLLIIAGGLLSVPAAAQDKIYKKDGAIIDAEIKEVGTRTIKYKRANNSDGPDFVIGKNEVEKIRYENGTEDYYDPRRRMMDRARPETASRKGIKYGNNILAANPLQIMTSGESSYTGNDGPSFGFGISYERILDKNGIVSFYLPAYVGFLNTNSYNTYYGPNPNPTIQNKNLTNIYIMPGLKFYPTGQGLVKYAVGPSAAIITGEKVYYGDTYDQNGNYIGKTDQIGNRFTFGLAINNSLNISPTPHLYLGLEMALGVSYINKVENISQNTTGIFQFGFKAGYRF